MVVAQQLAMHVRGDELPTSLDQSESGPDSEKTALPRRMPVRVVARGLWRVLAMLAATGWHRWLRVECIELLLQPRFVRVGLVQH